MKTKTFLKIMFFSSLSSYSHAQVYNDQKENKWQISLLLNTVEPIQTEGAINLNKNSFTPCHRKDKSYSTGLNISYKAQESFFMRLSAKITEYNIEEKSDSREVNNSSFSYQPNYFITDIKGKSSVINISLGVLWNFKFKIIYPYGGFQLTYKYYNRVIINDLQEYYSTATNNLVSSQNQTIKQGGGFAFGVGPFIGFSIKAYKGLSVGTEFSSAFLYHKLSSRNFINVVTVVPNTPTNQSLIITGNNAETNEGVNFTNIMTSLIISINF